MIAKDSKSYPYLAIAQHYNIPYAEVLKFSDMLDNYDVEAIIGLEWQEKVFDVWSQHETPH